jgi:hypothetical protein
MNVGVPLPPSITVTLNPSAVSLQGAQETRHLDLKPYEVVRATVVEGGMHKVELEMSRQRLSAQTKVPLKAGQKLQLQVVSTFPHLELRILNQTLTKHLMRTLHLFGRNFDPASLAASVGKDGGTSLEGLPQAARDVFLQVSRTLASAPQGLTGNDIGQLAQRLGLNLEAMLGRGDADSATSNLKAALFSLLEHHMKDTSVREEIQRHIYQIEMLQLCRARLAEQGIRFLPLPFPFLNVGYVLQEQSGEREQNGPEGQDEERCRLTLHLQMSELGNLEVRLLAESEHLYLRVLCDGEDTAGYIRERLGELRDSMSSERSPAISVGTGAADPEKRLMELVAPDGESLFETTV